MRTRRNLIAGLVFGLGLALAAGTAFADDDQQFPMMTAQWWQSMLSVPTSVNPLVDVTGVDCMVGQRGPVWFLGGIFNAGPNATATRTCAIPAGEWLFFPVVNYVNFNTPNCGQSGVNFDADLLRSQAAPIIDSAVNLSVHIDGQAVKNIFRVKSVVFAVTVPADNLFGPNACATGVSLAAGPYSPSIDDGYYGLLSPLSVGQHTLHIHGELPALSSVEDITYNLTIVPVSLK